MTHEDEWYKNWERGMKSDQIQKAIDKFVFPSLDYFWFTVGTSDLFPVRGPSGGATSLLISYICIGDPHYPNQMFVQPVEFFSTWTEQEASDKITARMADFQVALGNGTARFVSEWGQDMGRE